MWGYALLTNDTKSKALKRKIDYETDEDIKKSTNLSKSYSIYEEVSKLANKNQILSCRVFNKVKFEKRIIEVDVLI